MDIHYVGEQLLPGKIGQFFVVLSFGAALFASVSYFFATKEPENKTWKSMGRIGFWLNAVSVTVIGAMLFHIIYSHLFEYHYAWAHSSKSLPTHYVISAFWEGQEGSFWLWTFWQAALGAVLLFTARSWESPVMTSVMLCQAFLASMLLGVEILGARVGSSPFILLRDALQAPIFSRPDYLQMIADGNGLNPLLQNYWMVIHPPTLFLGFASMIVPFSYAAAGLWTRRYRDWMRPGLPWALFAVMILGAGIIMGSFWAYEALTFGGFWAWDPVENVSIIPWLTLIAAVHVMLAFRHSGHGYFTATLLSLVSFVLVVYASYLTRSGILGETSVHSFTGSGMSAQLIFFNLVFLAIVVGLLVWRRREMPSSKKEEDIYSREFWLFIGALVLTVSCVQMIATTSIPVFNALFGTRVAPPVDPIPHYNKWQGAFAVVVLLLTAFAQFLKYKQTSPRKFWRTVLLFLAIAMATATMAVYATKVYANAMYILLAFSAVFCLLANGSVLADAVRGKWRLAGSAVAHIGFAMLVFGALVAAATSEAVSINESRQIAIKGFGEGGGKLSDPGENLFVSEDEPVQMGGYRITYIGDSIAPPNVYYKIRYEKVDEESGKTLESFVLKPFAQNNPDMGGLIGTPDTRHYLTHDIYTLITAAPADTQAKTAGSMQAEKTGFEDYEEPATYRVRLGDTLRYRSGFFVIEGVNREAKLNNLPIGEGDVMVGLSVKVVAADGKDYRAEPIFLIKDGRSYDFHKDVDEQGLRFRFANILPQEDRLEIMVYQKPLPEKKWIVFKAIKFPYINFFWGGTVIMTIGFVLAIFRRWREA